MFLRVPAALSRGRRRCYSGGMPDDGDKQITARAAALEGPEWEIIMVDAVGWFRARSGALPRAETPRRRWKLAYGLARIWAAAFLHFVGASAEPRQRHFT